jgi:hypothetical protein
MSRKPYDPRAHGALCFAPCGLRWLG